MAKRKNKKAIIIGAGPAGLTAAYELCIRTNIIPTILEKENQVGGLAKTINFKGNRLDIGGHRFFSKSDRVINWWLNLFSLEKTTKQQLTLSYQQKRKTLTSPMSGKDPKKHDRVMLIRKRKSRIYYNYNFFSYPVTISWQTFKGLGMLTTLKIILSYLNRLIFPIKKEENLEDVYINKFGDQLYQIFFKAYTEKVWGVPCNQLDASWARQRVRGLSLKKAIVDAFQKKFIPKRIDLFDKSQENSLIEYFLYPKYGPGQLWQEVARLACKYGANLSLQTEVSKVIVKHDKVIAVEAIDKKTRNKKYFRADYFFSTMPIKDLIEALKNGGIKIPSRIYKNSQNLKYRDFLIVGLLIKKSTIKDENKLKDNWVYIQDPNVRVARVQIFNNWSPYMVTKNNIFIGAEYFLDKNDQIWKMKDKEIINISKKELERIGLLEKPQVIDGTVVRLEKAYPAYVGSYSYFDEIRQFLDKFDNLYLIGRNGMHRYNNQDHSMLTAMVAVDNIVTNKKSKDNIWSINI